MSISVAIVAPGSRAANGALPRTRPTASNSWSQSVDPIDAALATVSTKPVCVAAADGEIELQLHQTGRGMLMALLVVGLRGDAADNNESVRTVDLGAAGSVDLVPQGLESGGTQWYSAEVDDDDADPVVEALLARPEIDSAYRQPPTEPAG